MKFPSVTKGREAVPMEMAMIQMMQAWWAEHRALAKVVEAWSSAAQPGGGGAFEVDSHDELDGIMAGFPFAQMSHMWLYPLADLDAALAAVG